MDVIPPGTPTTSTPLSSVSRAAVNLPAAKSKQPSTRRLWEQTWFLIVFGIGVALGLVGLFALWRMLVN